MNAYFLLAACASVPLIYFADRFLRAVLLNRRFRGYRNPSAQVENISVQRLLSNSGSTFSSESTISGLKDSVSGRVAEENTRPMWLCAAVPVYFDFNSSEMTDAGEAIVDGIIKNAASFSSLHIRAYADPTENVQSMLHARVKTLKERFLENGVAPEVLHISKCNKRTMPRAALDAEFLRKRRRVEVYGVSSPDTA